MAISTRWSRSPVTRPAHSPSIVVRPSSSRPSSAKKEMAASSDSTTMPTLSIRLTVIGALPFRPVDASAGDVPEPSCISGPDVPRDLREVVVELMVTTLQSTDLRAAKRLREHADVGERDGLVVASLIEVKGRAAGEQAGQLF